MKLTDGSIVFVLLIISNIIIMDIKVNDLIIIQNKNILYNRAIDKAVEDAMFEIVNYDNGDIKSLDKQYIIDNFFNSLYINLGIMEEPSNKSKIKSYIPVIALIFEDCLYIYFHDFDEKQNIQGKFSKAYYYIYEEEEFICYFNLNNTLKLYNKIENKLYYMKYEEFKQKYPNSILAKDYEQICKTTIINKIQNVITEYFNNYNQVTKQIGLEYNFSLPLIEKEQWYRTIKDISIIAFFQGMPYGTKTLGYYERTAISGARLKKIY